MKVGVHSLVWTPAPRGDAVDLVRKAADLGFDAIELSYAEPEPTFDVVATADALASAGLEVALCGFLSEDRDISSAEAATRDAGVAYLSAGCRTAARLGGRIFCGPIYATLFRARDLDDAARREEWNRSVESMQRVGRVAEQERIVVAIEPLNRFETDFLNTVEQGLAYVRDVGSPAVRLMLDTFHMNIEERSQGEAIRAAGEAVVHVHSCENDRGVPGDGLVPWAEVRDALRDIGYEGLAVVESFNWHEPVLRSGARIWRPLAASPDELARRSAAFLTRWAGS